MSKSGKRHTRERVRRQMAADAEEMKERCKRDRRRQCRECGECTDAFTVQFDEQEGIRIFDRCGRIENFSPIED